MHVEKISLLIITDTTLKDLGGSEKHIRFLVKNLPSNKYNIVIVELHGMSESGMGYNMPHAEYGENIKSYKFNVKKIYGIRAIRAYCFLARIIDDANVDIVLSFHEKSDILNSLLKRKFKNNIISISSRRDLNICPSHILLKIRAILLNKMDYIIAPSKSIISFVLKNENYQQQYTRVIPNSVDVEHFNKISDPTTDITGFCSGKVCGICVANLKDIKGHKYLIDAFHLVCAKYPDAILLLVGGDSGGRAKLQEQVKKLSLDDNIHFLGRRTDVSEILAACHYMVSSSLSEGLSNSLLEGLATGLPLIATNVGGNGEIVEHGLNGFLCEARNPDAIANHVMRLIGDPKLMTVFGDASRKLAEQRFHQNKVIAAYDSFFTESILRKKK